MLLSQLLFHGLIVTIFTLEESTPCLYCWCVWRVTTQFFESLKTSASDHQPQNQCQYQELRAFQKYSVTVINKISN